MLRAPRSTDGLRECRVVLPVAIRRFRPLQPLSVITLRLIFLGEKAKTYGAICINCCKELDLPAVKWVVAYCSLLPSQACMLLHHREATGRH
jgi:hypothetical protein